MYCIYDNTISSMTVNRLRKLIGSNYFEIACISKNSKIARSAKIAAIAEIC